MKRPQLGENLLTQAAPPAPTNPNSRRFERTGHALRKIASITSITLGAILALIPVSVAVDQLINKNEITVTTDDNGHKKYAHSDPNTTHILNYLAGREKLSDEEKLVYVKEVLKNASKLFYNTELPENFDNFTVDELDEYMSTLTFAKPLPKGEVKRWIREDIKTECPREYDIYNDLWKLEIEATAPTVSVNTVYSAFATPDNSGFQDHYFGFFAHEILYNIPFETCSLRTILPEMAHAKQFSPDTVSRYTNGIRYILDLAGVVIRAEEKGTTLQTEYDRTYSLPGSIEYEAHQEIEKELRKKYPSLMSDLDEDKPEELGGQR